jgi:hypothetical protein
MSSAEGGEIHPPGRRDARRPVTPARWHADAFQDAVWDSELSLKAKALAVTYARHARDEAGDRTPTADLAWLTYERAMAQTSIGKRAAISTATKELVTAGWLVPVRVVRSRPTVYRLTIRSSHVGTTDQGETGNPVVPTGELPADAGSSLSESGSSLSESDSSPVGTAVVPTGERDFSYKRTSQPSSSRSAPTKAYIVERTGADDDEAEALIEKIKKIPRGGLRTTIGAYVRGMPDEDLAELLAEHRVAARPPTRPPDNRPPGRQNAAQAAWRADLDARAAAGPDPHRRNALAAAARAALAAKKPATQTGTRTRPPGAAMDELRALTPEITAAA